MPAGPGQGLSVQVGFTGPGQGAGLWTWSLVYLTTSGEENQAATALRALKGWCRHSVQRGAHLPPATPASTFRVHFHEGLCFSFFY